MDIPDDYGRPIAAVASSVDDRRSESAGASRAWNPLWAWRLQQLYGATLRAVRSIVEPALSEHSAAGPTILQIGGTPNVLSRWLRADDSPITWTIEHLSGTGDRIGAGPKSVDCLVAIDWLPGVAASQRERAVADACRVARFGVIFVNAFDTDAARTASHVINDLHRAIHGSDHPLLGRCLEIGWPDANIVQRWLEPRFPFVHIAAVDDAAIWQAAEALAMTRGPAEADATDADVSAAAVYPAIGDSGDPALAFRSMIVASQTPVGLVAASPEPASSWSAALAIHHALEAAAARRSLDALVTAVTTEREREREEFRSALASLAAELREADGRAEFLAREIRARDTTIGNQHVLLASAEARVAEAQTGAAHAAEAQVAEASRLVAADAAREMAELRHRLAATEHDADAYRRFLASRAGRALRRYTRIKNFLRRR